MKEELEKIRDVFAMNIALGYELFKIFKEEHPLAWSMRSGCRYMVWYDVGISIDCIVGNCFGMNPDNDQIQIGNRMIWVSTIFYTEIQ